MENKSRHLKKVICEDWRTLKENCMNLESNDKSDAYNKYMQNCGIYMRNKHFVVG